MAKPRVFISHSARNDTEALELITPLTAALRDEFAVRVDLEDLQLGVNWRSSINDWINRCDAAVVLLSEKALKSPYVAHEVTLLTARAARKDVTVIPVFLSRVDYKAVQDSALSPSLIQDIQSVVNEPDQQRRVECVKDALLKVKRGMIPVNMQTKLLAGALRKLDIEEVKTQLSKLEPDPDSWVEDADPHLSLAIKMMSLGIEGATGVMREFLDTLKRSDKLYEVFELAATSWVDRQAAEYVKQIAVSRQVGRALATNGTKTLITEIYVWCASEKAPNNSWTVVEINGILSEQALDQLKGDIEVRLRRTFNLKPEDDLQQVLGLLDESGEPIFVTLLPATLLILLRRVGMPLERL
jgi:hypothetical protein